MKKTKVSGCRVSFSVARSAEREVSPWAGVGAGAMAEMRERRIGLWNGPGGEGGWMAVLQVSRTTLARTRLIPYHSYR